MAWQKALGRRARMRKQVLVADDTLLEKLASRSRMPDRGGLVADGADPLTWMLAWETITERERTP